MGGVVVLAIAGVGLLYMNEASKVGGARAKLTAAQAAEAKLQHDVHNYDSVTAVYSDLAFRQGQLRTAMATDVRWSEQMNDISLRIPANLWLVDAKFDSSKPGVDGSVGTVSFTGKAFGHTDVAAWLDALSKEKGYVDPYFSKSEKEAFDPSHPSQPRLIDYDAKVTLTATALSGRYSNTKAGQ
jgi:Tfp pilus assembly protein PilN